MSPNGKRIKGTLLINASYYSKRLELIYQRLVSSASQEGIELDVKRNDELNLYTAQDLKGFTDFVLLWDKDVNLANRLENAGVRVFNSAKSTAICDDKAKTYLVAEKNNIPFPKTIFAPKTFERAGCVNGDFVKRACEKLGYPVIIKECFGSYGEQVYLAKSEREALDICKGLGTKEFLLQKFVSDFSGKDIRVTVVGNKVVCAILRENENSFKSNLAGGGRAVAYPIDKDLKKIALKVAKTFGLDHCGIDFLKENGKYVLCEVNSNPGFLGSEQVTGVDVADKIFEHIKAEIL